LTRLLALKIIHCLNKWLTFIALSAILYKQ
jgi:hypothetical protein